MKHFYLIVNKEKENAETFYRKVVVQRILLAKNIYDRLRY